MAKKKSSSFNLSSTINKMVEKSIQSVMAVVAEHSMHVIEWVRTLPNLKRKIKHLFVSGILALAGIIILALGVSDYLAAMFPGLANGMSHIVVGGVLLVIALIYTKMD